MGKHDIPSRLLYVDQYDSEGWITKNQLYSTASGSVNRVFIDHFQYAVTVSWFHLLDVMVKTGSLTDRRVCLRGAGVWIQVVWRVADGTRFHLYSDEWKSELTSDFFYLVYHPTVLMTLSRFFPSASIIRFFLCLFRKSTWKKKIAHLFSNRAISPPSVHRRKSGLVDVNLLLL